MSLGSCLHKSDFGDLTIESSNPILAIPLVTGSITSEDLIEEMRKTASVIVNDQGVYAAQFHSEPFIQTKSDIFPKIIVGLPIPILDNPVSLPVTSLANATISKATLSGDQLIFILNSRDTTDVVVDISIPNLSKGGEIFTMQYMIPFSGTVPSNFTSSPIDLSGYDVAVTDGTLRLEYKALRPDGKETELALSFVSINALDFSFLEGQIGSASLPTGLQSIDVNISDTLLEGSYRFEDPKMHFDITNSFGIPLAIQVNQVYLESKSGEQKQVESILFDQTFRIAHPSIDQIGETVTTRITFDKSNSNVVDLVQVDIAKIWYDVNILTNPDNSLANFFLTDSSLAKLTATIDLSFAATIRDIGVQHKAEVFLQEIDSLSEGRIKVFVENGIPLSFAPSFEFFARNGFKVPLPSTGSSIAAARTDSEGMVLAPVTSSLYYSVNQEMIQDLTKMDSVRVDLRLQSPLSGTTPSVIKPGQRLDFGIGIEAHLR